MVRRVRHGEELDALVVDCGRQVPTQGGILGIARNEGVHSLFDSGRRQDHAGRANSCEAANGDDARLGRFRNREDDDEDAHQESCETLP